MNYLSEQAKSTRRNQKFTLWLVDATGVFCYNQATKKHKRKFPREEPNIKSDFLTNLFFRALQTVSIATMIVRLLLPVAIVVALYLLWRIARNLEKPPKLTEEVKIVRKSLSEMLKENRTRCKMTQEFVAESIGVSRQAVSKWENGTSEPNTSNLMALAKLYGIPAEDLLKGVESALEAQEKEL